MTQASPQTSFIDAPFLYITGLGVGVYDQSNILVSAGRARDINNSFDIVLNSDTFVNTALHGVNGLDTGTIAANTWYAVFLIYNSALSLTPACLLSANLTSPSLPYGYNYYRRIGWAYTDSSSHLIGLHQANNGLTCSATRYYQWPSKVNVLSAGTATSFATVNLSAALPPVIFYSYPTLNIQSGLTNLALQFTGASVNNTASIRPSQVDASMPGSSTVDITNPMPVGAPANYSNFPSVLIAPGVISFSNSIPSIDYVVSAGALSIWVVGFYDNL